MPTSCPIPQNVNPAQANGFRLSITKLPDIGFFCTEANVPGLTLPPIPYMTPLSTVQVPGETLVFDDFQVRFLIAEDFSNYEAVFNWMVGLGFPESHDQYRSFLRNSNTNQPQVQAKDQLIKGFSDGVLQVLNSSNNPSKTIRFVDMYPTSLNSLQLDTTYNDVVYLAADCTFAYNYFKFD